MRSDWIGKEKENKIIQLLKTTTLTYPQIGKQVGCSRGPVCSIKLKYNISRPPNKGRIRDKKKCKYCKKYINNIISRKRPNRFKFCSRECYNNWQKSSENRGENNPRWKGGTETELQLLRKTNKWKIWRESVFKRDNYTCQNPLCNQIGGELHPHHIVYKSKDSSKIFDISNGLTLCKACHMKLHFGSQEAMYAHG